MRVHLMLLTAWAITGIDADTTETIVTEHQTSHVIDGADTDAKTTLTKTIVTEHQTSHVIDEADTDAKTTLTKTIVTEHQTSHVIDEADTDAKTTLTKNIVTEHQTSHVIDGADTDADTKLTKTIVTEHQTSHVIDEDADTTHGKTIVTKHHTSHVIEGDADTTHGKIIVTKHHTSHVIEGGTGNSFPIVGHKETSEAHVAIDAHTTGTKHVGIVPLSGHVFNTAIHPALPPEDSKKNTSEPHVVTDSLSKPTMKYIPLGNNDMHITCFSKSGVLPIEYQLFLHDLLLQRKTVYKSEPANFTMAMTPGAKVYLICTAISQSGEKSSNNVTLRVDDSVGEDSEPDQKDHDSGYEHLIPPQYILTSVTREARKWNNLVLITCGPLLLVILVIVIIISYLRSQKEQLKSESILIGSRLL